MAHSTSLTHKQSPAVEKRRSWSLMFLSSMLSAAVALGTMFVFAAIMNPGAIRHVAGTTIAGALWGIVSKLSSNVMGSETVSVILQSRLVQQSYRKTIEQHIGAVLGKVMTSILTNTGFDEQNSVWFDICDDYRLEDKGRHVFCSYSFKVLPEPGTLPRSVNEGIPPLDLPTYDPSSIHIIEDKEPIAKGKFSSIRKGTVLGLTSGASSSLMSLLLGTAGVVLGVIFATMLVKHFTPPKHPERAALQKEFAIELRRHMDRLQYCARDNNIGLEAEVHVAWMSAGGWRSKSVHVQKMASLSRSLSGRLVWADEIVESGVRVRRERRSIADGTASLESYRTNWKSGYDD
ncbi:hypothetical protein A9Z42_0034730 [Trichoderma parareesei]|uniref:Uncharacterized protein n=1 Tax=Trichoderma parareesei TaxID=858221 RepID=A0A2H2ZIK5_TRIPA|nr:hypothetical protein A9Z42_0034730 [Trichoderma parareesei]